MDNLLPEFERIRSDEPSTTQTLAQFDVGLTLARPNTPQDTTKSTGQGVIADLLNWANEDRLQLDENRLIGAPPVPFSVRPVVHDIMKGGPLPYEGDEENLPVSEVNRGSPVSKSPINRVYNEEKKEDPTVSVPGAVTNVCFVHTVEGGGGDEEVGRGEITAESEDQRLFGDYDVFIKRSEKSISHAEVERGGRFTFSTGKGKASDRDLTNGVTFSLIKDDFSNKHFDIAMQTGLFGATAKGSQVGSKMAGKGGEKSVKIESDAEVVVHPPVDIGLEGNGGEEGDGEEQPNGAEAIPEYNGAEFVMPFQPGPLGMELEEAPGCVIVRKVMEGGQALKVERITEGTVVVGVEGFPVTTLDDLYQVMEALMEVDDTAIRRIHFFNQNEPAAAEGGEEEEEEEEEDELKEFFVTGGGQESEMFSEEVSDDLLAAKTSAKTALTETIPDPPPPVPQLPLNMGESVDDNKPATIYFQNKHSSMGLRVSWIDYSGELVPRKELHPGESYMERTFSTHPWVCTAVEWHAGEAQDKANMQEGMGMFMHNNDISARQAPEVSPALVMRLGDTATNALRSYNVLWDPSAKSMSFMPQTKISAGRIRASIAPENARSAAARVAFARAQVIQQLRDARMDPLANVAEGGLGAGSPTLSVVLFGNSTATYRSVFAS